MSLMPSFDNTLYPFAGIERLDLPNKQGDEGVPPFGIASLMSLPTAWPALMLSVPI